MAALEFVVNQAELVTVVTEDAAKFVALAAKCPTLKTVLSPTPVGEEVTAKAAAAGVKVR